MRLTGMIQLNRRPGVLLAGAQVFPLVKTWIPYRSIMILVGTYRHYANQCIGTARKHAGMTAQKYSMLIDKKGPLNKLFGLIIFFITVSLIWPSSLVLGEEKRPVRPKIGLVLSGGGARGATHVGILNVLEEMRIPVALVTGTSMGSAVGGLYAAGLTAEELEEVFLKFDWQAAFNDSPPRRDLSFRRKEDDRYFLVKARVGVGKEGIKLPRGLVEGQNFVMELRKLSRMTQSVKSFDDLPIPFRAMATDLVTGEPVIMDRGDLVKAIRASVAVSPLFTPVEIDGRLLVDGGYLRNIPVEIAQSMGADQLIVVNIGTPLSDKEEINSMVSVISQVGRLGGTQSDRSQIKKMNPTDVLIQPDLGNLSFTDFHKIPEFIQRGEAAARSMSEQLKKFSVSEKEYQEWRRSLKTRPVFPVVDSLEIRNGTRIPTSVIHPFIRQPMGQMLDPLGIQEDLARVYGLGYFEWLDYHVEPKEEKRVMVVDAPRKSWGPDYLKLGVKVSEGFNGDSSYGILMRYQMTEINALGAEFQVDGEIGTNSGVRGEFYQPIGRVPRRLSYGAPYFVFIDAAYRYQNDPLLLDMNNQVPFEVKGGGGNVGMGRTMGKWGRIKLGYGHQQDDWRTPTVPTFHLKQKIGDVFGAVQLDTLDKPGFPRLGMVGKLEGRGASESLGADDSASTVIADLGMARSLGNHTVRLKGKYATNFYEDTTSPYLYRIGGFLNLSGFAPNALLGRTMSLAQAQYLYRMGSREGPLYLGSAVEWGGAWETRSEISESSGLWSGSIFVAVDSGIGPVYVGYSQTEAGRYVVSFNVGQAF
ncbi:MAG: hypothetical protein KCHDKBKB_01343 [Elusimicrobia bacterium]|nr:hypothetical protein [Elusimicrobiota bacterium]